MPSKLENCQPVESFTSQELPGDSIPAGTLTTQSASLDFLPTQALVDEFQNDYIYFLIIKPLPGYKIDRSMVSINGLTPDYSGVGASSLAAGLTNGSTEYSDGTLESGGLTDFEWVMMIDSKGENWEDCDNNVVVVCQLNTSFVMPNNDYTISIDFGGTAVECIPEPIGDPNAQEVQKLNIWTKFLCTSTGQGHTLYSAFHFNDWDAQYAFTNQSSLQSLAGVHAGFSIFDDDLELCNPCGCLPDEWYEADPCVGQMQPTCFTRHKVPMGYESGSGWIANSLLAPPADNTAVFPSVQAMIVWEDQYKANAFYDGNSTSAALASNQDSGALEELIPSNTDQKKDACCGGIHRYIWDNTANDISDYNFLFSEYPTIEPSSVSGSPLPAHEKFVIKVNTDSFEGLPANSNFVDVWGAITIVQYQNHDDVSPGIPNNFSSSNLSAQAFDLDLSQITYYEYTAVNNQCHFDISGVTLEQGEDDHTVIVTVPYRTDLSLSRSLGAGNLPGDRYENRIFFNLYPITPTNT